MAMYRILLICLFMVLIAAAGVAQIPNAGFESWTLTEPDSWVSSNAAPVYTNVTKSSTAHSGSSAVRGDVVILYTVAMAPTIQSGPGGHGFAFAQRPSAITGWYQFNSVGGDRFGVNVGLFKGGDSGTLVGLAASADPTTRGSYTQFSTPFVYYTSDIPDVCVAQFSVALPNLGTTTHVGSYFILDDLAFTGASSVESSPEVPLSLALGQNYPNPFNPTTQISYSIPAAGPVQLTVHNLLGQKVATLVDHIQTAGSHKVTFTAMGLSSGLYCYRLVTQQGMVVRTMTMLK
jgi:hypothetical protein